MRIVITPEEMRETDRAALAAWYLNQWPLNALMPCRLDCVTALHLVEEGEAVAESHCWREHARIRCAEVPPVTPLTPGVTIENAQQHEEATPWATP